MNREPQETPDTGRQHLEAVPSKADRLLGARRAEKQQENLPADTGLQPTSSAEESFQERLERIKETYFPASNQPRSPRHLVDDPASAEPALPSFADEEEPLLGPVAQVDLPGRQVDSSYSPPQTDHKPLPDYLEDPADELELTPAQEPLAETNAPTQDKAPAETASMSLTSEVPQAETPTSEPAPLDAAEATSAATLPSTETEDETGVQERQTNEEASLSLLEQIAQRAESLLEEEQKPSTQETESPAEEEAGQTEDPATHPAAPALAAAAAPSLLSKIAKKDRAEDKSPAPHHEDEQETQEPQELASEDNTAETLATARDEALKDRPRWLKLRASLIALAVPLVIFALSTRAIASSAFLWLEYHRPGFPQDSYGFTTEERLKYGSYGLDYILNFAPSSYLADLRVGNSTTKLFLPSEVSHMTDVKNVMLIGLGAALIFALLALLSSRSLSKRSPGTIRNSLFVGSIITLVTMLGLAATAIFGWESFFTNFHHLFFPQGNWEFRLSDTLIRLYPPQFWIDAGIGFASLALLASILLLLATWPTRNRRAHARLLRDFRDEQQRKLRSGQ